MHQNKTRIRATMSFTYSLYIPRVFKGISQEQIRGTFYGQSIGKVGRVDLLKVYNERNEWVYNKAFVHFDEWFVNENANNLRNSIDSGNGKARIDYEPNRFWMLLPNSSETIPEDEQNNTATEANKATEELKTLMAPPSHPVINSLYTHPHPFAFQPIIPAHILANPYGYMEPPANLGNKDRYYSNYTAAHHAYFTQPLNQQMHPQVIENHFPQLQRSSAQTDNVSEKKN